MTVYIDSLIFFNSVLDYLILVISDCMQRGKARRIKMALSAVISGIASSAVHIMAVAFYMPVAVKIIVVPLSCLIAFGFGSWRKYISCLVTTCIVSLVFGGGIYVLTGGYVNISLGMFIILSSVMYAFTWFFSKIFLKNQKCVSRFRDIEVMIGGKEVRLKAFVDPGHFLKEPVSGQGVILINRRFESRFPEGAFKADGAMCRIRLVPVKGAAGRDILKAVKAQRVVSQGLDMGDYYAAVCDTGEFDAVMPDNKAFGEKEQE